MRKLGHIASGAVLMFAHSMAICAPPPAGLGETITYTYDPLGRLVAVRRSGTVNNGQNETTSYDAAGNRSNVSVTGVGTPNLPPPGPPPVPEIPPNQAPVAVNDSMAQSKCAPTSHDVLLNDYDPDGNTPLSLVSVSGGGALGTARIHFNKVLFTPNRVTGTAIITYTLRDALGATATGTLTIALTGVIRCDR